HADRNGPRIVALAELLDDARRFRVVGQRDTSADLVVALEQLHDRSGVLLVGGDDEAARAGVRTADVDESLVRLRQHCGQPVTVGTERGAQTSAPLVTTKVFVEGRGELFAVARTPFHVAIEAGEENGPYDA